MKTLTLKGSIAKKLVEEARKFDLTPKEYLLEILTKNFDPQTKITEYIKSAESFLEEARKELKRNNIRQAAEKIWGAASLTIKAYALWKEGKRLASHSELWEYKTFLANELGEWVRESWFAAQSMHTCFYEGWCDKTDVEIELKYVEKLVKKVKEIIGLPVS